MFQIFLLLFGVCMASDSLKYNLPPVKFPFEQSMLYGSYKGERVGDIYHPGHQILDNKGRYILEWVADLPGKTITFNITVRTRGWIGLGLSHDGTMKNADMMIGGVKGLNEPYIRDYYSDFNRRLNSDTRQDWRLINAEERNGVTHLNVLRTLDTCDSQDLPITEDLARVIWAYGEDDSMEYHFDKRGMFRVYLLDPILKTPERDLKMWRISKRTTILPKETTYWCTIHKAPVLQRKHHIVEVHPYLAGNLEVIHTHHMTLRKCVAPPGMNARDIFEPLVGYEGEECYFNENHQIPVELCSVIIKGWAYGGKPFILPESVGIPIGEKPDDYWMLNIHFNNPELLPMTLESGYDLFYSGQLRKDDGQSLFVHFNFYGLFVIPPITQNLEVHGICTTECTKDIVGDLGGIEIVAAQLHTHYAGRKIKLLHFRNGVELPWILKDDNYDPSFQQTRVLREPRLILPGDQLLVRCEFDNTWSNGTTMSGFATKDEMCFVDLTINKRIPHSLCMSKFSDDRVLSLIGVQDYEWDLWSQERVVTSPSNLKGKLVSDVANSVDWTKALRQKLQDTLKFSPQTGTCPVILNSLGSKSSQFHATIRNVEQEKLQNLRRGFDKTIQIGEFIGASKYTVAPTHETSFPHEIQSYKPETYCKSPQPSLNGLSSTNLPTNQIQISGQPMLPRMK